MAESRRQEILCQDRPHADVPQLRNVQPCPGNPKLGNPARDRRNLVRQVYGVAFVEPAAVTQPAIVKPDRPDSPAGTGIQTIVHRLDQIAAARPHNKILTLQPSPFVKFLL